MRQFVFAMLIFAALSACASEPPCANVSRSLTVERKEALAPAIAKQIEMPSIDVLQSFKLGDWSIIYVDTHQSDEVFLFYAHDPLTSRYVTMWSGGAARDEEEKIRSWAVQNAPGIPAKLAGCFAWHVTKDRDL
jgi:hypothetical protein